MHGFLSQICRPIHPSWAFYAGIWGIVGGIVYTTMTEQVLVQSWAWLLAAGALWLLAIFASRPLLLSVAFLAGVICANYRMSFELLGKSYFANLAGETVTLIGEVSEDPNPSNGNLTLRLNHLQVAGQTGVAGTAYVQLSDSASDIMRSDRVALTGKLSPGFGTFVTAVYRPTLESVERANPGDLFARLKTWFANQVHDFIPSPEADLGLGYLMGLKSGLPEKLTETLRLVGMTHVIVASGTHLGILVSAAKRLFGKLSKFAGLLGALLLTLGFVLIVGFTPSMTRAALVTSLSLLVGYVGRKFTPVRLLSFVASITLLINPTNLLNLGWQLSFASFAGILLLAPRLQRSFYGGKKPPWLAAMLLTSIATSLVCAPVLIYNFGTLSLLALVANLLILPTLPYVMLFVLLTGVTGFWPWLAQSCAWIATKLLDFHIFVVNSLSTKQMLILGFEAGQLSVYIIYVPLLVYLCLPSFFRAHRRIKRFSRQMFARERELCYNERHDNSFRN